MDGLIGLAEILQERVSAWTCFYQEQHPDLNQKLKEIIPSGAPKMTSLPAATFDCPNTRKNKRDYAALHKYGLLTEDVPLPRPRKKMAVRPALNSPTTPVSTSPTAPSNVSTSLSNLDTDIYPSQSISQVECETECVAIKQRDGTRLKERSWVWKYYQTTPESGTWKLGDKERPELKHRCIHLQQTHKLFQDGHSERQGPLSSWITKEKKLPFEEAILDWIISTCQPFTCVEQPSFRAMLRSVDFEASIPSADTVSRRLDLRLDALDGELRTLMASASSIALSLDGWTSQNSLPMLAINAHWMSSAFQQHRACIEFVEITGNHSGENLANIVAAVLERFHISDKVMTITADNASNNDTLHRCLFQKLCQRYDEYLADTVIREGTMRFTQNSQIRCFAHILNLAMKRILRSLRASSHREACDFLDDVAKTSWKTINVPTSPIAKLRLLVLWIARSPQRIQKWDNRPGCTKAIHYDVDTRWNSTFVMIERAEECRRQLEDTVNDEPDIEALRLTPNDWRQLSDIKKILAPLTNTLTRMFEELLSILLAIKERRGDWQNVSPALTVPMSDGITLLERYHGCVKDNDIYYIASVLDPRIKTKWLKTLPDGERIINRIRVFLKKAYPSPKQPISTALSTSYKSFEYRFLEAFQPTQYNVAESDIDRYFNTPTISTGFDISQSQTEFIRKWWKINRLEFTCMAKVAQDHLAIPAAEVDIEKLFNDGRDVLGIRRFSMKGRTLGTLLRLKDAGRWKSEQLHSDSFDNVEYKL
ncbi:hypothetical protein N7478_010481 [Penicillium angulare]|uniref:uncharacterized protein n=1 Tax=Penicillium angulare TaxID=116970 RepID=UPI0025425A4D|nr:uncharacterized protein N7478_010481 [Penicillium angulare]KAJ5267673.1 hypothetical protein N7478_010481 [Penicillium angulare]